MESSEKEMKKAAAGGEEYYVIYLGGDPELSLKGPLCATVTSTSLEFTSAYFSTYKSQNFKIPLPNLKGANFMSKRQMTAWGVFFLGLIPAYLFKERKNYVVIEYEDKTGQTHNLIFGMFQQDVDDEQKISFIKNINSALMRALKKYAGLKCPSCGKEVLADFVLCPYCGEKLKD